MNWGMANSAMSQPRLPISRFARQVRDGDDPNGVSAGQQHSIGKPAHQAAAHAVLDLGPRLRRCEDAGEGALDRIDEPST